MSTESEDGLRRWRSWAQFVYLGGGPVTLPDDALQAAVNQAHDTETQALKAELADLRAGAQALVAQWRAEAIRLGRHTGEGRGLTWSANQLELFVCGPLVPREPPA